MKNAPRCHQTRQLHWPWPRTAFGLVGAILARVIAFLGHGGGRAGAFRSCVHCYGLLLLLWEFELLVSDLGVEDEPLIGFRASTLCVLGVYVHGALEEPETFRIVPDFDGH